MSKAKYVRGNPITSFASLLNADFIYFCHKVYHRGWFESWQLRWVNLLIRRGCIYEAVLVNKYDYKTKAALFCDGKERIKDV